MRAIPDAVAESRSSGRLERIDRFGDSGPEPSRPADPVEPLPVGRLLMTTLVALGLLTVALGAAAYYFRPVLLGLGEAFVEHLGVVGVALGFFIPDAFTVPLPADLVTSFALFGGMPLPLLVAWASLGSLSGGSVGWLIGRYAGERIPALHRRLENDTRVVPFLRRNALAVLALTAVTPLPYSIGCVGAGAIRMPYANFLMVSLLRIPRIAAYLWLIERGILVAGGLAGGGA